MFESKKMRKRLSVLFPVSVLSKEDSFVDQLAN
jgi:hypothetical protein